MVVVVDGVGKQRRSMLHQPAWEGQAGIEDYDEYEKDAGQTLQHTDPSMAWEEQSGIDDDDEDESAAGQQLQLTH
eukprot:7517386-Prorocentrum_lima.AAC.1